MYSKTPLSGFALATVLTGCSSTWSEADGQCTDPLITLLSSDPQEAYSSESVTITAYLENTCTSVPVLTFPGYDTPTLPGYSVEPFYLTGIEGIVLEQTNDDSRIYTSAALPLASFAPGNLGYTLTVYAGFAAINSERKDTLNNYLTVLSPGE